MWKQNQVPLLNPIGATQISGSTTRSECTETKTHLMNGPANYMLLDIIRHVLIITGIQLCLNIKTLVGSVFEEGRANAYKSMRIFSNGCCSMTRHSA